MRSRLLTILFIFVSFISFGQNLTVCGSLYGEGMNPLSYATVQMKRNGQVHTSILPLDGQFCDSTLQVNDTLIFGSVGYSYWKYVVKQNSTILLQLEAQLLRPALYGSNEFLYSSYPARYAAFEEKEGADVTDSSNTLSLDQNNVFTLVRIELGYRGNLNSLEKILSKDIWIKNRTIKETPLTIQFKIRKDTLTDIRITQAFDPEITQQIKRNLLEKTQWTEAMLNGTVMITSCELPFLASVKRHRLILKLQYK